MEARKGVVDAAWSARLLVKTEPSHPHGAHCERCDTVLEPIVSDQWFVSMKPLAEPAIEAVRRRRRAHRAGALRQGVLPLDGEHPRLVHLAPAVVGPPHPGVVLRQRPSCSHR